MDNTVSSKQRVVNEACDAIKEMATGTTLTHVVLAEMLKSSPRTQVYYNMVTRLRKQLVRDHSIFLGTNTRIGYVIAEPGQEIDIQDNKCKKATNQYVKAVKGMQYINVDKITDEQLKQRTLRIAHDRANIVGLLRLGNPDVKQINAAG